MFVKWTVTYLKGVSSRGRENEVVECGERKGGLQEVGRGHSGIGLSRQVVYM